MVIADPIATAAMAKRTAPIAVSDRPMRNQAPTRVAGAATPDRTHTQGAV
jgi:hypothetical protein